MTVNQKNLGNIPVHSFPSSRQFVDWLKLAIPMLPVNSAQIGQRARPDLSVRSASNLVADMVAGKWNKIGLDQAGAVLGAIIEIADENSISLPPFTVIFYGENCDQNLKMVG